MKKLFDFRWLTARFFKPRRRTIRPINGRLETLQLRTVPAAIASMPIEDAGSDVEIVAAECVEVADGEFVEAEIVDGEFVAEGDPESVMFMAFSSFAPVDEGEAFETFAVSDFTFSEGEVFEGEVFMVDESSLEFVEVGPVDGEVPNEWMLYSMAPVDGGGEEGEFGEVTAFEESGEVIEEVVEDGSETFEIKPYYRTFTGASSSEDGGEGEVVTDEATGEEVLFKVDVVEDGSTSEEGGENPEISYFTFSEGEVFEGEVFMVDESSLEFVEVGPVDGEVPNEWMLYSMAPVDGGGEEGEFVEVTAFEESGEVVEGELFVKSDSTMGEEVVDGEVIEEGVEEVVEDGSETFEIKPYYRTFTGASSSEDGGEGEVVTDEATGEEVLFKGDVVEDGSTSEEGGENPEIFYTFGAPTEGEVVDDGEITDKSASGEEPVVGEEEVVTFNDGEEFNPEIIYYSTAGGGIGEGGEGEGGGEEFNPEILYSTAGGEVGDGSEEVLEVTTTSEEEGDPEIRTLGGAPEVTTFEGVVQLCVAEYGDAGQAFVSDLQAHVASFTQLVGLISEGIAQNGRDIAAAAAAGDNAAIADEIAQNQELINQLNQLVSTYVSGFTQIQQNYLGRVTAASQALNQAAANPAGIGEAASTFSAQRLATRPVYQSDFSSFEADLQDLLDAQNGDAIGEDGGEGFAPDELPPAGDQARIRQGNAQVTASISEVGQSVNLTGDIESVAQPGSGESVTVAVNLWNTDDTLGDEAVYISGVTGNVVLSGTDDGAEITGGKLTIDGINGDNPFSFTIDVPADVADTVSFDDDGNLSTLGGQYAIPATEGLLPNGGTLVVSVTINAPAV